VLNVRQRDGADLTFIARSLAILICVIRNTMI
jgi:hypothetical protein